MRSSCPVRFVAALLPLALLGGCPTGITITLPGGTDDAATITIPVISRKIVRVEIFNDTAYEVVPRIRFDDDSSFFARMFPAEELTTGVLAPGELLQYDIDCDKLGLVFSDEAGQYLPGEDEPIGQAEETRILRRGTDYDCGDVVIFQFIGSGYGFGAIVSVDNMVVD